MAVALVEPVLGAETPNRVLNEARKIGGERRIEVTCIELAGDAINDLGTAAGVIASGPIRMRGAEAR